MNMVMMITIGIVMVVVGAIVVGGIIIRLEKQIMLVIVSDIVKVIVTIII